MGMPGDEFITDAIDHLVQRELPLLPADPRIKNDVKQQIPQFLFDPLPVFFGDGIGQLVHLFYRQRTKGPDSLFPVPGTFLPQIVHDLHQTLKSLLILVHKVFFESPSLPYTEKRVMSRKTNSRIVLITLAVTKVMKYFRKVLPL